METLNINKKLDLISFLETEHRQVLRAQEVAMMLGVSRETIYDWNYRAKLRKVPEGMFIKIGRMLFLRSDLLKDWLANRIDCL